MVGPGQTIWARLESSGRASTSLGGAARRARFGRARPRPVRPRHELGSHRARRRRPAGPATGARGRGLARARAGPGRSRSRGPRGAGGHARSRARAPGGRCDGDARGGTRGAHPSAAGRGRDEAPRPWPVAARSRRPVRHHPRRPRPTRVAPLSAVVRHDARARATALVARAGVVGDGDRSYARPAAGGRHRVPPPRLPAHERPVVGRSGLGCRGLGGGVGGSRRRRVSATVAATSPRTSGWRPPTR